MSRTQVESRLPDAAEQAPGLRAEQAPGLRAEQAPGLRAKELQETGVSRSGPVDCPGGDAGPHRGLAGTLSPGVFICE
jgi:hypothetical protein